MCDAPHLIPNPNYGKKPKPGDPFSLKDCTNKYIYVPCGHCDACIANKQMQLVQRVQMETINNHLFFCTLTYNEEMIPKLTTSTGFTLKYCDIRDIQNMMKRLRKYNKFGRPFRYFAVSELGGKKGRPHAHIIFFIEKHDKDTFYDIMNLEKKMYDIVKDEWSRNLGSTKKPNYKRNYTFIQKYIHGELKTTYDLHYINARASKGGEADVAFYVLKYMLKPSDKETRLQQALHLNLEEEEYNQVWKKIRPRYMQSHGFGGKEKENVQQYLKNCVTKSQNNDYPLYFNPDTGQSFPLARYYKNDLRIYNYQQRLDRYFRDNTQHIDTPQEMNYSDYPDYVKHYNRLHKKQHQTETDKLNELNNLIYAESDN